MKCTVTKLLLLLIQKKIKKSIRKVNTTQYKLTDSINHDQIGANQNLNIRAVINNTFPIRFKEHASLL